MLHAFLLAAVLNGTIVLLRPQSGADEAVGGALVELSQLIGLVATATSAPDGTFSIPDLAPGTYQIHIASNHSETRGMIVVHEINPTLGVEVPRTFYVFDWPCGAMFGRVHDLVTGLGVPHARVSFIGDSNTDSNGDYFIFYRCYDPGTGYKFSGTSGLHVTAKQYQPISSYMRAESVNGLIGYDFDFDLQPLNAPRDRLRRQMTRDEIAAKLVQIVRQEKDIPDEKLGPDTVLAEAGIDSLDALTILFAIEEEFKITIPDEKAKAIKTFGDMIDAVESLTAPS